MGTLKSNQCGPTLLLEEPGRSVAAAQVVRLAPDVRA